ncbi:MAG: choice-of-anchor D domain-containing protein, partial [Verrucomicrobiaceae bacterium]
SSVVSMPSPELRVERAGTGAELTGGTAVDFGGVKPGENAELSFVIKNTGAITLGGLAVTFSGPDAARFSLVQAPADTVGGQGGGTSFTVRFAPGSTGLKTAALHLASTDPDENPFTLSLSGQGLNTAPVVAGLADTAIDEDGRAVLILTVTDAETPNGFTLSAVSSNPALLPVSGIVFGGAGPEHTLTLTPLPDRSGSATVTVTADDGSLQSAVVSLTLTVYPVNDPPTLDAVDAVTIQEDAGARTVNLIGLGAGPGESGQLLTVTAVSSNPALIPDPVVNHNGASAIGALTFTPTPNASGTATVTVRVADGQLLNDTLIRSFVVTVLPVNDPPTLDAIADPASSPEDSGTRTVNFTGVSAGPGESGQTLTVTAFSSNPALIPDPAVSYT